MWTRVATKPCCNFVRRGTILPLDERAASLQERARVRDDSQTRILREEEAIAIAAPIFQLIGCQSIGL